MHRLGKTVLAVAVVAATLSNGVVNTYAYANEKAVSLELDEYYDSSKSIKCRKAAWDGENTGSKKVYFIIEKMKKDGTWDYTDYAMLVEPGLKCPTISTKKYKNNQTFRLQLNPYGVKKAGGKAKGRIWPVKID